MDVSLVSLPGRRLSLSTDRKGVICDPVSVGGRKPERFVGEGSGYRGGSLGPLCSKLAHYPDAPLALHAPFADGQRLQNAEDDAFDEEADDDDEGKARKDLVGEQLVAVAEDVPAKAALAG